MKCRVPLYTGFYVTVQLHVHEFISTRGYFPPPLSWDQPQVPVSSCLIWNSYSHNSIGFGGVRITVEGSAPHTHFSFVFLFPGNGSFAYQEPALKKERILRRQSCISQQQKGFVECNKLVNGAECLWAKFYFRKVEVHKVLHKYMGRYINHRRLIYLIHWLII